MISNLAQAEFTPESKGVDFKSGGMNVVYLFGTEEQPEIEQYVPVPDQLISRYADCAVRQAAVSTGDDGEIIAEIPELTGVWAAGQNLADVFSELTDVVTDWVTLKLLDGDLDIPIVGGIDLNIDR